MGAFFMEPTMEDEIFLIEPEHQNNELVRKVAQILMRSSFQTWDIIEVTGRRVQLLGQSIEEIHRIGHVRFSFDKEEMKEILRLSYPSAHCWLENFKYAQQTNFHIAPLE